MLVRVKATSINPIEWKMRRGLGLPKAIWRLLTRNGHDWTGRFPLIAEAAGMLRARSFLIDGEAVACDGDGLPVFDRLRYRRQDGRVFLYAFDLLELNGQDMRRKPLEGRKDALSVLLRLKAGEGIQFNEHCDDLPADFR